MLAVKKTIYWLKLVCKNIFVPVFLSCTQFAKKFAACCFHWLSFSFLFTTPTIWLATPDATPTILPRHWLPPCSAAGVRPACSNFPHVGLLCPALPSRVELFSSLQNRESRPQMMSDSGSTLLLSFLPWSCVRQSRKQRFFSPSGPLNSVLL